jgi:hypothetical protein
MKRLWVIAKKRDGRQGCKRENVATKEEIEKQTNGGCTYWNHEVLSERVDHQKAC